MINLLPSEEKQKLLLEKKEKLVAILGIVVLVGLVCLVLVLLSIKFYLLAETDYQKNILAQIKQTEQPADFATVNNTIQKYNKTLAQLDSFYKKEIYFSQALKIITGVDSPKGLYLTNFSLDRDKNGMVQASVSGASDTRENLLVFKKNVEGTIAIKSPSFSPESWINPKNANFFLTFKIASNE